LIAVIHRLNMRVHTMTR